MHTPLLPLNLSGQAGPAPVAGAGGAPHPPGQAPGGTWSPAAAPRGPSPRGSNCVRWAVGGGVLGLLALCCIGCAGLGLLLGAGGLAGTAAARDAGRAAVAYFEALGAHDWPRAHDALSAGPRATTTPANLRATWTQREATRGALDRFVAEGVSLEGGKHATVRGVLRYKGAGEDAITVQVVEEGGAWKVVSVVTGPRAAQLPSPQPTNSRTGATPDPHNEDSAGAGVGAKHAPPEALASTTPMTARASPLPGQCHSKPL